MAAKTGCTVETLRQGVRQAERDQGRREGLTSSDRERLKALERDNRELKRAWLSYPGDITPDARRHAARSGDPRCLLIVF